MYGRHHSEKTRRKIGKSQLGKKFTIERKQNISEARRRLYREGKLTPYNKGEGLIKITCQQCKNVFETHNQERRFCSKSCARIYRNLIDNPMKNQKTKEKMQKSQLEYFETHKSPNYGKRLEYVSMRNRIDNPSKRLEVRNKKSDDMKKLFLEHPEKHPNFILRRNHITKLENKVKGALFTFGCSEKDSIEDCFDDYDFVYNYYLATNGGFKFPDFYFPLLKTIFEADGKKWHSDVKMEAERDRQFVGLGIQIIHLTEDIIKNDERLKECISRELSA
jgi:hypothetical protein